VFARIEHFPRLLDWMARIEALAQPKITAQAPDYALAVARSATPRDVGGASEQGGSFALAQVVSVSADDYAREQVVGPIVKLTPTEIAVSQHSDLVGDIAIHFPRLGFTIAPVAQS
jgi:hypothetical protein